MKYRRPETSLSVMALLKNEATRKEGLERFHEVYEPVIRLFALRCGMSQSDADDVVSEVLVGFIQSLDGWTYDPRRGRLYNYLRKCARNAVSKRRGRSDRCVPAPRTGSDSTEGDASESQQHQLWAEAWEDGLLPRAMRRLQEEWSGNEIARRRYSIVEASLIMGRSVESIMNEFGVSDDVVSKARVAAQSALKAMIEELDPLEL